MLSLSFIFIIIRSKESRCILRKYIHDTHNVDYAKIVPHHISVKGLLYVILYMET